MEIHWLIQAAFANAAGVFLLAAVAFLIGRWLRRPALTHALWVLVLVKFVTPPLIGIPIPSNWLSEDVAAVGRTCLPGGSVSSAEAINFALPEVSAELQGSLTVDTPAVAVAAHPERLVARSAGSSIRAAAGRIDLLEIVIALWLTGACLYFLRVSVKVLHFAYRLRSNGGAEPSAGARAAEIGRSLGLDGVPPLVFVPGPCSPMLWGFGPFARLVFPTSLWHHLSGPCRDALLTHELAHFQRRDHWVRPLEILVTGLFWWHPVLWWTRREIVRVEEACCDARVVSRSAVAARTYAEALLATVDYISADHPATAPAATGIGAVPDLECRLTEIMRPTDTGTMPPAGRWFLVITVLALPLHPSITEPVLSATVASGAAGSAVPPELRLPSSPSAIQSELPRNIPGRDSGEVKTPTGWWIGSPQFQWAVVESPDGRFRLIASEGNRVVVEDRVNNRQTALVDYEITSAGFTPDSRRFVAGERDGTVRVWDAETGEPFSSFAPHDAEVVCVAVSSSGQFAASGSRDGALVLWDLGSGVSWATWTASDQPIASVRIASDGQAVAVASGDWLSGVPARVTVLTVQARSLQPASVVDLPAAVAAIEFTPGNDALLAALWDGTVVRWDLVSGISSRIGDVDRSVINSASFSQDARFADQIRRPPPSVPATSEWTRFGDESILIPDVQFEVAR